MRNRIARVLAWIQGEAVNYQTYTEWAEDTWGTPLPPNSGRTEHADDDPASNYEEYLARTNPLDGSDLWRFDLHAGGGTGTLEFVRPAQTLLQAVWSTNLLDWVPWNVPGNGMLLSDSNRPDQIQGPVPEENEVFFRMRFWER